MKVSRGTEVKGYTTEPTFVVSETGQYKVAVTYQVGDVYCTDTSDAKNVEISTTSTSTLTVNREDVCTGASVTLTAHSGGSVYTWYDGSTRLDPTDSTITVSALSEGTHYFRYVDNGGCTANKEVIAHPFSAVLSRISSETDCVGSTPNVFQVNVDGWNQMDGSLYYTLQQIVNIFLIN